MDPSVVIPTWVSATVGSLRSETFGSDGGQRYGAARSRRCPPSSVCVMSRFQCWMESEGCVFSADSSYATPVQVIDGGEEHCVWLLWSEKQKNVFIYVGKRWSHHSGWVVNTVSSQQGGLSVLSLHVLPASLWALLQFLHSSNICMFQVSRCESVRLCALWCRKGEPKAELHLLIYSRLSHSLLIMLGLSSSIRSRINTTKWGRVFYVETVLNLFLTTMKVISPPHKAKEYYRLELQVSLLFWPFFSNNCQSLVITCIPQARVYHGWSHKIGMERKCLPRVLKVQCNFALQSVFHHVHWILSAEKS